MGDAVNVQLTLPADVFEWLEGQAHRRGLSSGAEFASKLLQEIASLMGKSGEGDGELTAEEEKLIEERLRTLGYIE